MCREPVLHLPAKSMGSGVGVCKCRTSCYLKHMGCLAPFPALGASGERQNAHPVLRDGTRSKNISATKPSKPALAQTAQLRRGGGAEAIGSLKKEDLC